MKSKLFRILVASSSLIVASCTEQSEQQKTADAIAYWQGYRNGQSGDDVIAEISASSQPDERALKFFKRGLSDAKESREPRMEEPTEEQISEALMKDRP
jgi:hypothetical protein